jgi:hypothetical protein
MAAGRDPVFVWLAATATSPTGEWSNQQAATHLLSLRIQQNKVAAALQAHLIKQPSQVTELSRVHRHALV